MYYTGDPIADYDRYDTEEIKRLQRLPTCAECGEPIQDEECFEIEDGVLICPKCLKDNHRKWTEDYIKE